MSSCKIDHTLEDVQKKLADQTPFLSTTLSETCSYYLSNDIDQEELNTLFHLLKKYDLANKEEKAVRNKKIHDLIENNHR